ncbi:MAG: Heme-binding protein A [Nitrospira sp.]|nr:Heme-binding protein A [Nitrospira sp.]
MRKFLSLILVILTFVIAGCGTPQAATPASPDAKPKSGGTLNVRNTTYYTNLDPTQALRGEASLIASHVMEPLLRTKTGEDIAFDDMILIPNLAETWEAAPDGKSFTFHLRKGVKFPNIAPVNGRELTSADVKWSFEYIARVGEFKNVKFTKSNQIAFQFSGLNRMDTPDPYTAVVRFDDAFAPFLSYVGGTDVYVTAHESYKAGTINDNPVGPGPWMADLPSWKPDAAMIFKRNPNYFQEGKPYVDEVRQLVLTDEASAMAAFRTKQVDIFGTADSTRDAESVQKSVPEAKSNVAMGHHAVRFYYNVKVAPLNNVKFRQAMSFATDREEFVKSSTGGKGRWGIDGGLPFMFTEEEVKKTHPYDLDQAKKLLQEIGYTSNPITIETLYTTAYGEQLLQDILLLQSQWRKAGINLNIVTLDRTDLSNRRRDGNYMMAPTGAGIGEGEPDNYLWFYFHPKSGANYYQVDDPKLTALADGQRREVDRPKREQLWRDQAKYVHDNGYALWPYFAPFISFWHPYVRGYAAHRGRIIEPAPEVWLDK